MKKECLKQLKNDYDLRDQLYLESRNYKWIITKETTKYRLNVRQLDDGMANLSHLEGHYETIKDIEKVIFERVTSYEFITY